MTYNKNPLVEWLLSHSYGQGGTVAVPSAEAATFEYPRGSFPAGIDDALAYLSQRYLSSGIGPSTEIDWCFLVGGPGNGKSEALRSLAGLLKVQLPERVRGDPVSRVLPASWPSSALPLSAFLDIAFVNDASIPRPDALGSNRPGSLFMDVRDALARFDPAQPKPIAIFANVNRGILVEEKAGLDCNDSSLTSQTGQIAAELIRWLAGSTGEPRTSDAFIQTTVPLDSASPHYGQCKVVVGRLTIVVHAIFLDVLSMLEPRPGAGGPVVDFSASPPAVAKYHTLGSLVSTGVSREETTAGRLLTDFAQAARWSGGGCRDAQGQLCDAHSLCPFAQNAIWLQADPLRHRFLDAMRGAEVAAGRRFTYRDLLGHVSLALIGQPEQAWLETTHPCDWSRDQQLAIKASNKVAAVALQSHRIYANLFGTYFWESRCFSERELKGDTVYGAVKTRRAAVGESPRVQAFERAFKDIDPARDTDPWDGSRSRVLDSVESLDVQSPSDQAKQWSAVPPEVHSEIESTLDDVLREEIASELVKGSQAATQRVRALRRWRAILMLRQVGLALGRLNFATAIQAWLAEQENALRNGQRMLLGDGLHHLVIPARALGHVFFAPLRPRTHSLSELPADTLLVSVSTTDLALVVLAQGDILVAEVQLNRAREKPQALAGLVVDLAVAREALLHADGSAHSFTEIGYTAFARIERARASLISRERLASLPAHFTDGAGQLFKVSQNPSGTVPLRIQRA